MMYDLSEETTDGLAFAGSTLSSPWTTVKVFEIPWLSTDFSISSPSASTSSCADRMKTTKSATRQASRAAKRSLLTIRYCTFCLKRSMLVRVHPASGTSSSMSRLEFRLRTAAAVETSEHSGIRAVILGAPSFPANTLEDFACSWSLLMRICLARLRRSILLTTCWWGVLRLPNSKERELTLPIQHSQQSPAWWW